MTPKWRAVLLIALAELLGMGLWFSASAVTPSLVREWQLSAGAASWLTLSVQLGFVAGALASALLNLADRYPPRRVFAAGAALGALANAAIALLAEDLRLAVPLRFVTGASLAAVYPVGMKIMTTWMREDRGLGLGILVGALSVGSATPHLIRALGGGIEDWRAVLHVASVLALLGGVIVWRAARLGPHRAPAPRFEWRYIIHSLRDRGVRLANLGYLGHMWELYAMWTWIPIFMLESYRSAAAAAPASTAGASWVMAAGPERTAAVAAFATIAMGGPSCVLAGYLADRLGRTTITMASMLVSGSCCLLIGLVFSQPLWVTLAALVWGFSIVADSAQFSSSVSELCDRRYVGTALTVQTSLGFLLTLVSIRLIPVAVDWLGWRWAFVTLALGPYLGVWAMWRLRRSPAAVRLAGGRG